MFRIAADPKDEHDVYLTTCSTLGITSIVNVKELNTYLLYLVP